jgi:ABC-type transport system involved in cytochrome c biogenesis permease component
MSASPQPNGRLARSPEASAPTWWLVFVRELTDLWIGGKALILLLLFSLLLGVLTYVMASNSELSLIPPKEMVYETLKTAIGVGIFIGLIIGADSISGERERSTLEALLLTPTSRTQIVLGKFLAAISPWPAALLITIPFLNVLSQGDEVFGQAALYGAILGTVMVPAYVGVGMLVSFWSSNNRNSFFISLGIYILFLVPAQLPGKAQTGVMGQFLQWVNPMAATSHFLSKILVNNFSVGEWGVWLTSPFFFAAVVLGVLFVFAAPGLRLLPGRALPFRPTRGPAPRVAAGATAGLVFVLLGGAGALGRSPALALQGPIGAADAALQIAVDMEHKVLNAGDHIVFNTSVTNSGTRESPPLILAMNIVNLDGAGSPVDPEDWSPQRSQAMETLPPGRTARHAWRVNAILDGDYMVYMVVVPRPGSPQSTTVPVASTGIHLTVMPFTKLNPLGVLPFAIGVPLVLLAGTGYILWRRRRAIAAGEAE